jgi:DNA-binding transcriptional MerR regulator
MSVAEEMDITYTIGILSSRTGLSQHTIRAWERRYQALSPGRSGTNRRIYLEGDIERLSLLKAMVESGHGIGQVARLPTDQLRALGEANRSGVYLAEDSLDDIPGKHLAACRAALEGLDSERLEESLVRAGAVLGVAGLLENVVIPLLAKIEEGWLDGSIRISQEHMASAVLRSYLDQVRRSMPGAANAPRLIVTTPRDQHHEIGALIVAIVAAMQSWRVLYLGPNLPSKETAEGVRTSGANAIALSLVYPVDDPNLASELRELRDELGPKVPIVVGGRAAAHYADVLDEIGARICPDLRTFREVLHGIVAGSRVG